MQENVKDTSGSSDDARDERLAEATGDETLSAVRSDAELTEGKVERRDPASTPAPDGDSATAPVHGRADGSDSGGVM